MTTISPAPFPESGSRKLSPKETMQRAKAVSCTLPTGKRPSCSGQVFVGLFFDGTDNNLERDYDGLPPERRRHSNVVKLFHTHVNEPNNGYFSIYIPGVGTKFPEIGDSGASWESAAGSAAAWKGEDRIIWGLIQVLNAPHRFACDGAYLIPDGQAKTIVSNTASATEPNAMRRVILNTWLDKLAGVLKSRTPKVEQINLSVFGFSRGAAEARACVNWLFDVCKPAGGGWTLAGIPIRVQFLGIFDTVASVGLANLFDGGALAGHQGWADNTQEIHPAVERCVHYVAGHEVRACFPLDSVRVKSTYPANAIEVMYPGSHSDLGGGYAPNDLGISPKPEDAMAIIPGVNMYHEARASGVPLIPMGRLDKEFKDDLRPSESTVLAFNAYLRAAGIGGGPVEEMGRRHMGLYFSYRFKHRTDFFQRTPYASASPKDRDYLKKTQVCLIERLSSLKIAAREDIAKGPLTPTAKLEGKPAMAPDFDPPKVADRYETFWNGQKLSLEARQAVAVAKSINVGSVKPEIEQFFDHYLHDSVAGFIGKNMNEYAFNGMGLAKFRTVFKGND